jgi:hypothetical protein
MRFQLSSRGPQAQAVVQSPWLLHEFVKASKRWREECAALRASYDRWRDAEPHGEPFAYAAYAAALDREERAAVVYRDCADRIASRA